MAPPGGNSDHDDKNEGPSRPGQFPRAALRRAAADPETQRLEEASLRAAFAESAGEVSTVGPGVPGEACFHAEDKSTWTRADDMTAADWQIRPGRPMSARHKELARLFFVGKSNVYISERMGLTTARISLLRNHTQIKLEISRLQEKAFELTISERLTDMGPAAADTIEHILTGDDPNVKIPLKKETAIWVLEKLSGKASQSINHESSTLDKFYNLMADIKEGRAVPGAGAREVNALTGASGTETEQAGAESRKTDGATEGPASPEPADGAAASKFASWSDDNL